MGNLEKKEYTYTNEVGDATITVYDVFPGVQLAYHSVHMDKLDLNMSVSGNFVEILHCKEGRIEQEFEDEFFYLMPGDLSIAIKTQRVKAFHFPLQHYHGITIGIDLDRISDGTSSFMEEAGVQPLEIAKKLCGNKNSFITRSEKYVEHIFSELYDVPENIKLGYFKLKIMELLLILSEKGLNVNQIEQHAHLSKLQVQLANQIAAYLSENMGQHITIEELAKRFNVSVTHLKSVFKAVYGVPVFSYIRIQKMQSAAQVLIHTDEAIAEIAYQFGYSNISKFSAAFQKIMGDTPSEYRKEHRKYHL